jgi:hypothetical protein
MRNRHRAVGPAALSVWLAINIVAVAACWAGALLVPQLPLQSRTGPAPCVNVSFTLTQQAGIGASPRAGLIS